MADGADFSINVQAQGAGEVAALAATAADLAQKLGIAQSAATAASDAMKAGQAAYNQSEAGADRAAKALEKIGLAADAQKAKLAGLAAGNADGVVNIAAYQKAADKLTELNARQAEAAGKSQAANAALAAEAASLDRLRSAASAADAAEAKLNKEHTEAAKAAKDAEKATKGAGDAAGGSSFNFRALGAGLGKLGGPLGSVGSAAAGVGGAVQKLGKSLGAAGPYVAAAVLAIALAAAFAVAALAITKFGIVQADAARTSALLSAGIAHSVAGGEILDAQLDDLAGKVPIARDELAGMAKGLSDSGLRGKDLSTALQNAAVKAAQLKFGPDFQKELLSLNSQSTRLKSNVATLFGGLKIEGFLEALYNLGGLLDANTASGKAIKTVFEAIFQPIVDGLTGLIPKATSAFLQFEILALKAAIALKPHVSILKDIGYGFLILAGICVVAVGIIVAVLLAAVAVPALLIAAFLWLQDTSYALGQSIRAGIGAALDWLSNKFDAVVGFLQGLSLSEIGTQLIQGLIDGITGGGAGVLAAIAGIAGGAVDAAKKALGIASPSKVFAEIGMHTAAGMEQGVDKGSEGVQSSVQDLVDAPAAASAAPAAGSVAASSGGASSSKGGAFTANITVNAGSEAEGQSIATAVREEIRNWWESLGVQLGTEPT